MRDIKFRAWDKNTHSMINASDLTTATSRLLKDSLVSNDRHTLMQYTELIDKNGVEIYEGDIVEWQIGFVKGRNKIIYTDGSYVIDSSFHDDMSIHQDYTASAVEVIGNIYQNPELLKQNT